MPVDIHETPAWLEALLPTDPLEPAALMDLAIAVANASVEHGGGPFGAVIADGAGRVVDAGWNSVIPSVDSTAHAEIVAIRRAQRRSDMHSLRGLVMHASCEPCIQCFGAIYWSDLAACHAAATKEDAEELGFDEGPVDSGLWERARSAKGLLHHPRFHRSEASLEPLRRYKQRDGSIY